MTSWQKSQVQRLLADDLHSKHAALYAAEHGVGTALMAVAEGVMPPDSNLMVNRARSQADGAREAFRISLERWKEFVIRETVPEDLEIP